MTALGVALATGIYAAKANAEEVKDSTQIVETAKQKYDLYAGNLLFGPQDEVNSIFQLDNQNGARVITEFNNTPWTDKVNETSVAVRSPQLGRFQGEFSYDNSNAESHDYTGIAKASLGKDLEVRTGLVGNQDGNGGFVGGKASLEGITINGNVFRQDGKTNANGYVSYSATLSQDYSGFVSIGGSTRKDKIVSVAGVMSDGKAGFYNQVVVDEAEKEQTGKLIFVPAGFSYTPGTFHFKSAVLSNAGMNGEFSDNTMIGWAPYDANAANGTNGHTALVGKWENNEAVIEGSLGYWNRPNTSLLFGITPKISYDKNSRQVTSSLIGDIYSDIPRTPLGAALEVEQNLRDGSTNTLVYLGYSAKF